MIRSGRTGEAGQDTAQGVQDHGQRGCGQGKRVSSHNLAVKAVTCSHPDSDRGVVF